MVAKIDELVVEHKMLNNKQNKTEQELNRLWEIRFYIRKNHFSQEWENNYEGVNFNYRPLDRKPSSVDKLPIKIENIKMEQKTLEVLKNCTIDGLVVKLPNEQLTTKEYADVKKNLELIGGKWKGGKVWGFLFQTDPTDSLHQIANGEKRNLKKEFQFFETPEKLADQLIDLADLKQHDTILEPSAGQGAIIKAINKVCDVVPDCFELMDVNTVILSKSGLRFNLIGDDFFKHNGKTYSKIIANPPFTKNQDIDHLKEMYECLSRGGRLVCITSESWENGSQKKQVDFRHWLYKVKAEVIDIEKGSFKESGTMVGGKIVIINKSL